MAQRTIKSRQQIAQWPIPDEPPSHEQSLQQCITEMKKLEGHDGPVSLHWLIREIPSYQTLQYLGIGLKHKIPNKD